MVPVIARGRGACVYAAHRDSSKNPDRPARKYCFKATARIVDMAAGRPYGVFTAYDSSMSIGDAVDHVCDVFAVTTMPDRLACEGAEIVLLSECPTEISDEIYFHRFRHDDDTVQ